ncbi:hypothetical protein R1flu_017121 [Riccia fluitans]|uniref:Uncharacterized protein n=1 Tax=Riccia fluitans TaxID=41844 RepID=A0ABD1YNU9_9MARC
MITTYSELPFLSNVQHLQEISKALWLTPISLKIMTPSQQTKTLPLLKFCRDPLGHPIHHATHEMKTSTHRTATETGIWQKKGVKAKIIEQILDTESAFEDEVMDFAELKIIDEDNIVGHLQMTKNKSWERLSALFLPRWTLILRPTCESNQQGKEKKKCRSGSARGEKEQQTQMKIHSNSTLCLERKDYKGF